VPNTIKVSMELEGKDALRTLTALNKGVKDLGKTGTKSIKTMDLALGSFVGNLGSQAVLKSLSLVSQGFKQGTKNALEFGKAVAEVNSIVPRTAAETLVLKKELIGLSNEFGDKAQTQARAFYNILSAGVTDTATALGVLKSANKAAVAGLVDVDTAARGLLSVTNSYADGTVNAAQASDILFVAVREGRTTFGELADTIGRVASISSAAKIGFDDIAGTLAFVTKSGIRTDEAVIGLRAAINSIIGPTDEVRKLSKSLGLEFKASAIEGGNYKKFFNDLKVATGGNIETLRKLFPNVRAFNVAVKIAGGDLDDFNRILGETSDATGATDKALSIITDSAAFQFEKLTNQLSNFPTAILTNFEEPISDALKVVNEFVGGQGLLLIPQAMNFVIEAFEDLLELKDDTTDFIDSVAEGASNLWNAIGGGDTTVDDLTDKLGGLNSQLEKLNNTSAATQARLGGLSEEQAQKNIDARRAALEKEITVTKNQIDVFNQADLADAERTQKELKRRSDRKDKILAFQKTLNDAEKQFIAGKDAREAEEKAKDEQKAKEELDTALGREEEKFNAIQELKLAQKELEAEAEEQEKLDKQLAADEEFQFLVDNLGRAATLKELARIKEIDDEKKRRKELKKLREKAQKEEMGGILSLRKFEDLTNKEKIAAQKSTLQTISTLSSSSNSALFAIGKASSLALAGINVAEGVTKALAAFPPPFNFAAAAAVGAAGAINIAKIASAKKPSAGNFQGGGIIDVPGGSQTGDQLTAGVNNREGVFNLRQQKNLFRAVDSGNLGGGGGITINNPQFLNEEMVDDVIDRINDRVEFGNKRLTASEVA